MLHFSLFLTFLYSIAEATSCNYSAISLPLKDVQVLPDIPTSFMRGIQVTVGTPAQNIVVLPWAELNNTWLYDYDSLCDDTIIFSDTICQVRRGNYFFENTSTTFEKTGSILLAGGAGVETVSYGAEGGISDLLSTSLTGSEDFSPGTTGLSKFPIGIARRNWDHGYTILHAMGMGSNSTYLNSLVQTGQIASRVWSIFWGRMWVDQPLDGQVVVGGYDQAKVIGQNYTQALDYSNATGCWTGMKVTISDIELVDRNGATTSIFPPNFALPVCIVPQRQLLIEAPETIFDTFENKTATKNIGFSFGVHWGAQLYDPADYYHGDMMIKLSSGLQVTVPNDQFMVEFVSFDRNGSQQFNESRREFLYGINYDRPPSLGRYFLTAAYLMINHDANTFTLWQANPSTASDLVTTTFKDTADSCTNVAPNGTTTNGPGGSDTTAAPIKTRTGLSPGAAAGIAVGVVAVVALLAVLGWFMFRRKTRRQGKNAPEVASSPPPPPFPAAPGYHEVDGNQFKSELDGRQKTHEPIPELL